MFIVNQLYCILPESFRDVAVLHGVIPALVPLLDPSSPSGTRLQALRAIGNLCFDHGQT